MEQRLRGTGRDDLQELLPGKNSLGREKSSSKAAFPWHRIPQGAVGWKGNFPGNWSFEHFPKVAP